MGVKALSFQRPSPVAVTDRKLARLLATVPGDPAKGLVAEARAGRGDIVVIGDSLWWSWIGTDRDKTRNLRLLENLLKNPPRRK